jgi:hypothetical protein
MTRERGQRVANVGFIMNAEDVGLVLGHISAACD